MPKPVLATRDELLAAKAELEGLVDVARKVAKVYTDESTQSFVDKVKVLTDVVGQNAREADEASKRLALDAKTHADQTSQVAFDKAQALVVEVEATQRASEAALQASIERTDNDITTAFSEELSAMCKRLREELASTEVACIQKIERMGAEAAEALVAQRQEIDRSIAELRTETHRAIAETREEAASRASHVVREQVKVDEAQDLCHQRDKEQFQERIEELKVVLAESRVVAANATEIHRKEAVLSLAGLRDATAAHLAKLDAVVVELRGNITEVTQVPARRIEWLIQGATAALTSPSAADGKAFASWMSPKFDAAGAHDLQIELRVSAAQEGETGNQHAKDCALFLWADKGLHILFRCVVGSNSATVEKLYTDRMPHGTKRFCCLKDNVSTQDDTLRVGVEILELIREIEEPVRARKSDGTGDAKGGDSRKGLDGHQGTNPFDSSLIYYRHVNNRLLPQIQREVDMMRARTVRRIEWLVERASALPQYFPPHEPICSPVFNAAGVENMQLIFYPSGYAGATKGFCSFYLYCPAGVTMRGHLSVGPQKREAHNTFEESGAYGRKNFCRYEACFDADNDTVLLALDIEDMLQELHTKVALPLPEPAGKLRGPDSAVAQTDVATSLRLATMTGRNSLTEMKVLPSLWTSRSLAELAATPDGYHPFEAFNSHRKISRPGLGESLPHAEASASLGSAGDGVQRSESTPALRGSKERRAPPSPHHGGVPAGAAHGSKLASTDGNLPLLGAPAYAADASDWGLDPRRGLNGSRGRRNADQLGTPPRQALVSG